MQSEKYFYRLKQIDFDGNCQYSPEITLETTCPREFRLSQNYPNPFNATTMIRYQLPIESRVELCIYSVTGQNVATLVSEQQRAGNYTCEWHAGELASGVYFFRMTAGEFSQVKKPVLLKQPY